MIHEIESGIDGLDNLKMLLGEPMLALLELMDINPAAYQSFVERSGYRDASSMHTHE